MEPSPLTHQIAVSRAELINSLSGANFYMECIAIGVAIALAWLIARLIQSRVKEALKISPPRRIDTVFITQPLKLLTPLMLLIYLSVIQPFVVERSGGVWLAATMKLTMAYFVARCLTLVIRARFISYLIASVIMIYAALDVSGFAEPVVTYLDTIGLTIGKFRLSLLGLINGAVILVIVFWLAALTSRTLESYLRRSSSLSYTARELTVKFFRLFVYFIALIVTLSAIGVDLTAFAVFGGALGVGIGLGLQKITANFVSGITLLLEKSIRIGDVIEVGGMSGIVRELNVRYALVETNDGRELMIPNDELISTRVINWTHTHNRARIEVPVLVSYAADAELVRKLLLEAASESKDCLPSPAPDCWLQEFGPASLKFVLVFWIMDMHGGRRRPQSDVMFTILNKLRAHGIEMPAAPQMMLVRNIGAA
jgi:small-conductance mechanosensitive channel